MRKTRLLSWINRAVLISLLCMLSFSVTAANWRGGTGENTILGTENASDIDTASYENVVAPLDRVLSNYKRGCQIDYLSVATLTVKAGEVMLSNAAGTVRLMQQNTSDTIVTWANIDAGAEAASTRYYIYAYQNTVTTTTFSIFISTSSSAPTGATYYKRLGSFYNDASSDITQIDNDDISEFINRGDPSAADYSQATLTIDSAYHDLDLSSIVTAGATSILLQVGFRDGSVGHDAIFRMNDNSNAINISHLTNQVADTWIYSDIIVPCDASRVIEYNLQTGMDFINVTVKGWWD